MLPQNLLPFRSIIACIRCPCDNDEALLSANLLLTLSPRFVVMSQVQKVVKTTGAIKLQSASCTNAQQQQL